MSSTSAFRPQVEKYSHPSQKDKESVAVLQPTPLTQKIEVQVPRYCEASVSFYPIGAEASLREYIQDWEDVTLEANSIPYAIQRHGTSLEGDIGQVLKLCQLGHEHALARGAPRMITHITIDSRMGVDGPKRTQERRKKNESVEPLLEPVSELGEESVTTQAKV